jgi:hypothetical protein
MQRTHIRQKGTPYEQHKPKRMKKKTTRARHFCQIQSPKGLFKKVA